VGNFHDSVSSVQHISVVLILELCTIHHHSQVWVSICFFTTLPSTADAYRIEEECSIISNARAITQNCNNKYPRIRKSRSIEEQLCFPFGILRPANLTEVIRIVPQSSHENSTIQIPTNPTPSIVRILLSFLFTNGPTVH